MYGRYRIPAFLAFPVLLIGMLVLCSRLSYAQEYTGLSSLLSERAYSPADSAQIIRLINTGARLARGNNDSALQVFQQAGRLSEAKGFRLGAIRSLHSMGTYFLEKGATSKALVLYRASLQKCGVPGSLYSKERSAILNNIGSVFLYTADYDTAARYFYEAAALGERYRASPEIMLSIYNNLASVMDKIGERQRSLHYLDKAITTAAKTGNTYAVNLMLYNKGLMFRLGGRTDSAIACFRRSLDMSRQYRYVKIELATLLSLGNSYTDPDLKTAYLQQAVRLAGQDQFNYRQQQLATLYELAGACFALKKYAMAETTLAQLEEMAGPPEASGFLLEAVSLKADIYAATGRYLQAYQTQKEFSRLSDSLLNKEKLRTISDLEARYHSVRKDKEIAGKQLHISRQDNELKKKNILIGGISAATSLLLLLLIGLYRISVLKQRAQQKQMRILKQEQEIAQLKAMMEGEERERGRLARELHDGIGGMLASVKMSLGVTKEEYRPVVNTDKLDKLMHMISDTAAEVRKTAHNLMPEVLTKHSLAEALVIYCDQVSKGKKPDIDVQFRGSLQHIDKATGLILYRIIQEIVQNMVKHSMAEHAAIQLIEEQGKIRILAEDNGRGFDTGGTGEGYGLLNLRNRVQALNGELSVMSEPGKGVTIFIEFDHIKTEAG